MRNSVSFRWSALLLTSVFLSSCVNQYKIAQSQREAYPINANMETDSSVISKYLPYKLRMDSQMNEVIGYSAIALSKKYVGGETLLGNFFSDAALQQALKIDSKIDFAFPSTNGGLRNDLPKGAITLSNIFELMPFENELLVVTLKGSDVKALADRIASSNGQPVAGITFQIRNNQASDIQIAGQPFDRNKNYRVLTSDYIAGGGDGVNIFKNALSRTVLGLKVRDALIRSVKELQQSGQQINTKLDRRITHD